MYYHFDQDDKFAIMLLPHNKKNKSSLVIEPSHGSLLWGIKINRMSKK